VTETHVFDELETLRDLFQEHGVVLACLFGSHAEGRAGLLSDLDFAARVAELAGFRNVLVHEYLTIDPLKAQEALDAGLDDLRAFVVYVTDYLKEEGTIQRE